jgi:hypothetical protein
MTRQLSRRDFLKLSGTTFLGFVLSACGGTPTPTQVPTPTQTPSPTNSPVPTNTPTLTATPMATVTATSQPTSTATPRAPTLRGLAERIIIKNEPFRIGTEVDYGDPDWKSQVYEQTVHDEFNLIAPGAAFSFQWMDKYPTAAPHWLKLAEDNDLAFEIKPLFWQGDEPFSLEKKQVTKEQVINYFMERIRKVLPYVSRRVPTRIVLANEPFWEYKGNRGWQGEYGGSPFYQVLGEQWITEAYVRLYQIADSEFHLTAGKDFRIIGIIERGIDSPGLQTDFVTSQVKKIKQAISSRMGISLDQILFDLGTEFHFGEPYKDRDVTVPYSRIDKDAFKSTFVKINQETGCPIHVTETTDLGGTEEDVANAYRALFTAAIESGVVQGIEFWSTFRFPTSDYPWRSRLFLPGFKKAIVYQTVLETLAKYS